MFFICFCFCWFCWFIVGALQVLEDYSGNIFHQCTSNVFSYCFLKRWWFKSRKYIPLNHIFSILFWYSTLIRELTGWGHNFTPAHEKINFQQLEPNRFDGSGLETEGDRVLVQAGHFYISKRATEACLYSQLALQDFSLTPCCAACFREAVAFHRVSPRHVSVSSCSLRGSPTSHPWRQTRHSSPCSSHSKTLSVHDVTWFCIQCLPLSVFITKSLMGNILFWRLSRLPSHPSWVQTAEPTAQSFLRGQTLKQRTS